MDSNKFSIALEKQLDSFKNATEWSDFVLHLTGLESVLRMYKFKNIPRLHSLYRRLNQCLNPALPSGVHLKTIDIYKLVITKIDKEELLKNINLITLGIFSFHKYSSLSAIPNYLSLINLIMDTLGSDSYKISKNITISIIQGLEDEQSDNFHSVFSMMERLSELIGRDKVIKAVWECMCASPHLIQGSLVYLSKLDYPDTEDKHIIATAFKQALNCKENLSIRRSFDVLLHYSLEGFTHEDSKELSISVLKLLTMREMSLSKRVYQWIYTYSDMDLLVESLREISKDRSVYFKILTSMNEENSSKILRKILPYTIKLIRDSERKKKNELGRNTIKSRIEGNIYNYNQIYKNKLFRDKSDRVNIDKNKKDYTEFFNVLSKRLIWSVFLEMSECKDDNKLEDTIDIISYSCINLSLIDEISSNSEIPLILYNLIDTQEINNLYKKLLPIINSIKEIPNELTIRIFDNIKRLKSDSIYFIVDKLLTVPNIKFKIFIDNEFWGNYLLENPNKEETFKLIKKLFKIKELKLPYKKLFDILYSSLDDDNKDNDYHLLLWNYRELLGDNFHREFLNQCKIDVWKVSRYIQRIWEYDLEDSKYIDIILNIISYVRQEYKYSQESKKFISCIKDKTFSNILDYIFSILVDPIIITDIITNENNLNNHENSQYIHKNEKYNEELNNEVIISEISDILYINKDLSYDVNAILGSIKIIRIFK